MPWRYLTWTSDQVNLLNQKGQRLALAFFIGCGLSIFKCSTWNIMFFNFEPA